LLVILKILIFYFFWYRELIYFFIFILVIYNKKIYIFGGYNGILDQHFNDLYCFDPSQNQWNLVVARGETPRARRRQICLVIGKKLYLFGGTRYVENKLFIL